MCLTSFLSIIYMSEKKDKKEIPKVLLELIESFSKFDDLKGREKREGYCGVRTFSDVPIYETAPPLCFAL